MGAPGTRHQATEAYSFARRSTLTALRCGAPVFSECPVCEVLDQHCCLHCSQLCRMCENTHSILTTLYKRSTLTAFRCVALVFSGFPVCEVLGQHCCLHCSQLYKLCENSHTHTLYFHYSLCCGAVFLSVSFMTL